MSLKLKSRRADRQLLDACEALNADRIRAAIAAGADVNTEEPHTRMTPLDIVAEFAPDSRRSAVFRKLVRQALALLLAHGANPEGSGWIAGETPLAKFRRHDPDGPCCRMLIAAADHRPAD